MRVPCVIKVLSFSTAECFNRLERKLTKENATDKELMEKIDEFHGSTDKICGLIKSLKDDDGLTKMDTYGKKG
jgi:hypothetical protein